MKKKSAENLSLEHVQTLRSTCNRFSEEASTEKKKLLLAYSKLSIAKVSVLKSYHDCLLFMLAHPESAALRHITALEMERCIAVAKQISVGTHQTKKLQMAASGISNSLITAKFSYDMVHWLNEMFPRNILWYSCDADINVQREIIRLLIPSIQREGLDKNFTTAQNWLSGYKKNKQNILASLLNLLEAARLDIELRDYFYDALQIYVQVDVKEQFPSRSIGSINQGETFFHTDELLRKNNALEIISQKIKPPLKLNEEQKSNINSIAKCSLLMLLRETDPITYSNIRATELHDMGRGIKIALFYSAKDRRMPVESYVGYMAFKNDLPVAYGGGWIFGNFSRIGLNIYAPFRGGESALLFAQILRLYKQRFNISIFEAEPYQIGKNNPEGIQSGAFWFYHRLGFRPLQSKLLQLSEEENLKINKDKSYRTQEIILKKLADSFMVLRFENFEGNLISTMQISEAVNRLISETFRGNQKEFFLFSKHYICDSFKINSNTMEIESKTFKNLAAMFCLITNLSAWNTLDKKRAVRLFHLREFDSEYDYILALQKHKKLWKELFLAMNNK